MTFIAKKKKLRTPVESNFELVILKVRKVVAIVFKRCLKFSYVLRMAMRNFNIVINFPLQYTNHKLLACPA